MALAGRPRQSRTDSSRRGPPGCRAQEPMAARSSPRAASQPARGPSGRRSGPEPVVKGPFRSRGRQSSRPWHRRYSAAPSNRKPGAARGGRPARAAPQPQPPTPPPQRTGHRRPTPWRRRRRQVGKQRIGHHPLRVPSQLLVQAAEFEGAEQHPGAGIGLGSGHIGGQRQRLDQLQVEAGGLEAVAAHRHQVGDRSWIDGGGSQGSAAGPQGQGAGDQAGCHRRPPTARCGGRPRRNGAANAAAGWPGRHWWQRGFEPWRPIRPC